jgi:ADP-L-glycero-D-manno-heptose 6-epimerase
MILVTGGAGFIGSILQAALAARGQETVVVDRLRNEGKWRNLAKHPPDALVAPEDLDAFLARRPPVEVVFHLGAISATTATDGDLVWATNVTFSQRLWQWCTSHRVRLIYASSAATYGNGEQGFRDDGSLEFLRSLRPRNLYGWSKHAFDLWVARQIETGAPRPPQWAGMKFFNVFGPNEYHKKGMISVVKVLYDEVMQGQKPRLFRSDRPDVADGEQRRDFVWAEDVVAVLLWLLETPNAEGLFNVGTGQARTYLDVVNAIGAALGKPLEVEFIPMPEKLKGQYQYFTQAEMDRLRNAGYQRPFTTLEEGVRRYVQEFLATPDPYL